MSLLRRVLDRTETLAQVDRPAAAVQRWLQRLLPDRRLGVDMLAGHWAGHPAHPALILAPIGAWLSAAVLDAVPGQQSAARKLVLTGLVTTAPAVAAGLVDYRHLDPQQRRVAFVHLLANLTASGCYAESYRSRRRGRPFAGQVWAVAGLAAVGAGGLLGGHLSYAQGAGVYRWQPERRAASPQPATHWPEPTPAPPGTMPGELAGSPGMPPGRAAPRGGAPATGSGPAADPSPTAPDQPPRRVARRSADSGG